MKTMKYILAALTVGGMMASCNTDIESLTIQRPLTYDDQYYQNLRDYKESDHEIAFGWFAQYGAQNSAAVLWDYLTALIFALCGVAFRQQKIRRFGKKSASCRK